MSQFFTNSIVPALAEAVPKGRVVTLTGSLVGLAANATEAPFGISFDAGSTGDTITVIKEGSVMADASGSISIGQFVCASADGDGKVIAIDPTTALTGSSYRYTVGQAQTAAVGGQVRIFAFSGLDPRRS